MRDKGIILMLFVSVLFTSAASAQKMTYKNGLVTQGSEIICRVYDVGSVFYKNYSFKNQDEKELIYFKRRVIESPELDSSGQTKKIIFFEIIIHGSECRAEIGEKEIGLAMLSEKKTIQKLADFVLDDGLISDNEINTAAAVRLCNKLGTPYSDEIKRLENTYQRELIIIH
jgi:hypothetical protein